MNAGIADGMTLPPGVTEEEAEEMQMELIKVLQIYPSPHLQHNLLLL